VARSTHRKCLTFVGYIVVSYDRQSEEGEERNWQEDRRLSRFGRARRYQHLRTLNKVNLMDFEISVYFLLTGKELDPQTITDKLGIVLSDMGIFGPGHCINVTLPVFVFDGADFFSF